MAADAVRVATSMHVTGERRTAVTAVTGGLGWPSASVRQ